MTGSLRVDLFLFAPIILSVSPGRLIVAVNGDLVQSVQSFLNPGLRLHAYLRDLRPKGREKEGTSEGERHFQILHLHLKPCWLLLCRSDIVFKRTVFVSREMVTGFSRHSL